MTARANGTNRLVTEDTYTVYDLSSVLRNEIYLVLN